MSWLDTLKADTANLLVGDGKELREERWLKHGPAFVVKPKRRALSWPYAWDQPATEFGDT